MIIWKGIQADLANFTIYKKGEEVKCKKKCVKQDGYVIKEKGKRKQVWKISSKEYYNHQGSKGQAKIEIWVWKRSYFINQVKLLLPSNHCSSEEISSQSWPNSQIVNPLTRWHFKIEVFEDL